MRKEIIPAKRTPAVHGISRLWFRPVLQRRAHRRNGAAFLCGHAGIEDTIQNSVAYLQNWLEALKADNKLIVQAAAQAQKAADFILGTKFEDATTG